MVRCASTALFRATAAKPGVTVTITYTDLTPTDVLAPAFGYPDRLPFRASPTLTVIFQTSQFGHRPALRARTPFAASARRNWTHRRLRLHFEKHDAAQLCDTTC